MRSAYKGKPPRSPTSSPRSRIRGVAFEDDEHYHRYRSYQDYDLDDEYDDGGGADDSYDRCRSPPDRVVVDGARHVVSPLDASTHDDERRGEYAVVSDELSHLQRAVGTNYVTKKRQKLLSDRTAQTMEYSPTHQQQQQHQQQQHHGRRRGPLFSVADDVGESEKTLRTNNSSVFHGRGDDVRDAVSPRRGGSPRFRNHQGPRVSTTRDEYDDDEYEHDDRRDPTGASSSSPSDHHPSSVWCHVQNLFRRRLTFCNDDALSMNSCGAMTYDHEAAAAVVDARSDHNRRSRHHHHQQHQQQHQHQHQHVDRIHHVTSTSPIHTIDGDDGRRRRGGGGGGGPSPTKSVTFLEDGARDPAARPSATTDDVATPAAAASSDEEEEDAENDGRFRVAVINKTRRRCELTTMGTDPLRVDNASYRGFDGTRSHYTVLDPAADVSTAASVEDGRHRSSPQAGGRDPYWRDVLLDKEHVTRRDAYRLEQSRAVLHIENRDAITNPPSPPQSSRGGGVVEEKASFFSPVADRLYRMASELVSARTDETETNDRVARTPMVKDERRMIDGFLNLNTTENDDDDDPPEDHRRPRRDRPLSRTTNRTSHSSLHRRRNSEFTFTPDHLGEICHDDVVAGSPSRRDGPPSPRTPRRRPDDEPRRGKPLLRRRFFSEARPAPEEDPDPAPPRRRPPVALTPEVTWEEHVSSESFSPVCSRFGEWLEARGERAADDRPLLEGWVGYYDADGLDRLFDHKIVRRHDVRYVLLARSRSAALTLHVFSSPPDDKTTDGEMTVDSRRLDDGGARYAVDAVSVSRRKGTGVVLTRSTTTTETLCHLVPVNLPPALFHNRARSKLVSARKFEKIQRRVLKQAYPEDQERPYEWGDVEYMLRYAPDAQHDAALRMLFVLNAVLKQQYDDGLTRPTTFRRTARERRKEQRHR